MNYDEGHTRKLEKGEGRKNQNSIHEKLHCDLLIKVTKQI